MKDVTKELTIVEEPEPVTEQFGNKTEELFRVNGAQEWGWDVPAAKPRPKPRSSRKPKRSSFWPFVASEIRHNPGRFGAILMVAAASGVWAYNLATPHLFELQIQRTPPRVTETVPATSGVGGPAARPLHRGHPTPLATSGKPKAKAPVRTEAPTASSAPVHQHPSAAPTSHPPTASKTASPPHEPTPPTPPPSDTPTASHSATSKSPVSSDSASESAPEPCASASGSPCS